MSTDSEPNEAFHRIDEIREQIRASVGRIDTLALLDAARAAEESAYTATGPLRILFVCSGDTCRSPMAAGLARDVFGNAISASSAGLEVGEDHIHPQAARALHIAAGIDISAYRPRRLDNSLINSSDIIIAMRPSYATRLSTYFEVPEDKIVTWDIDDPYNQPLEAYLRRIEEIVENLTELSDAKGIVIDNAEAGIALLRARIARYRIELGHSYLDQSEITGNFIRILTPFEVTLRELLRRYLAAFGISYDSELRPVHGKALDDLTLGQTVGSFEKLNDTLTHHVRSINDHWAVVLKHRRLLSKADLKMLNRITTLRKPIHANKIGDGVIGNVQQLTDAIEVMLSAPLYELSKEVPVP